MTVPVIDKYNLTALQCTHNVFQKLAESYKHLDNKGKSILEFWISQLDTDLKCHYCAEKQRNVFIVSEVSFFASTVKSTIDICCCLLRIATI